MKTFPKTANDKKAGATVPPPEPEPGRVGKAVNWAYGLLSRPAVVKHLPWCLALAVLVLFVFGLRMLSTENVFSVPTADVASQYINSQTFIYNEVYKHNPMVPFWENLSPWRIPMWNPYTYGGHSFVGDTQAAVFYPPTWVAAYLPPVMAINMLMAFHTLLIGLGMYAWAAFRGVRPVSAFLAGALLMFGGVFIMHVYAGHMSNLGTMAWAPFVFLGIDGWLRRRKIQWIILASAAVALQVYAGHAQYAYYTAIVAGLYSLLFLWKHERTLHAAIGLLAIYPVACIFAAAQLFPALEAMGESVRAGGTDFDFASAFGLPPENILTAVAPWFFGGSKAVDYWGRCYLWEMQLYMGVAGLALALVGLAAAVKGERWRWFTLLGIVLLLAFGVNFSYLYKVLYEVVPLYSSFRGASKFIFFIGLFLSLMAAFGLDRLLDAQKSAIKSTAGYVWLGLGALALVLGFMLTVGAFDGVWESFASSRLNSGEITYVARNILTANEGYKPAAIALSGHALELAGILMLIVGGVLLAVRVNKAVAWLLPVVAIVEVFVFAFNATPFFDVSKPGVKDFVSDFRRKNSGDYRMLNMLAPSSGMTTLPPTEDIWGNDPSVLKRYAQLMTFMQGGTPSKATQNVGFNFSRNNSRLFGMLRGAFAVGVDKNGAPGVMPLVNTQQDLLGRFLIVSEYEVMKSRDQIFQTLASPLFDLKRKIILEKEPNPKPEQQGAEYTVRLLGMSTDQWTLEIMCNRATMLVMTDAWARGWRAVTLPGSVQTNYEVIPANYVLRAVPLAAGRHVMRIEYMPGNFELGKKITFFGIALGVCLLVFPSWRRRLHLEPAAA